MTKEMFEDITKWQKETFPNATPISATHHLLEEVDELMYDLTTDKSKEVTAQEYADCFLLLFGSASLYGFSYDDICEIIRLKMEVNKLRKWGTPNDKGYVKHTDNE